MSEIALSDDENNSFVCCLCSLNVALWDQWKDTNLVKTAVDVLEGVMSEFISKLKTEVTPGHPLQTALNFAKNEMALGIGVMGLHTLYQKLGRSFGDYRNMGLNKEIFEKIQRESMDRSIELGEKLGIAPIFTEVLPPETRDFLKKNHYRIPKDEVIGKAIRDCYNEKGIIPRRHTTLQAIAPTTSSSAIIGQVSPGIEPYNSNYFKVDLAKGSFMRKNPQLQNLLDKKGLSKDQQDRFWDMVMKSSGSVLNTGDILTEEEKEIFKTFKEISQADIIQQASYRQQWIDQSQSLNLNIPPTLTPKEVNSLMMLAWESGVKTLYYQRSQSVSKELLSNLVVCSGCET